jgi:hypothetical protein
MISISVLSGFQDAHLEHRYHSSHLNHCLRLLPRCLFADVRH